MGSETLNTIRTIDPTAKRGVDVFEMDPDAIRIVIDKDDPLWDPDCEAPVDDGMLQSFLSGAAVFDPIVVVNRGKRGGEPDYVVVDGRNRLKCARERNRVRAEKDLPKIRIPVTQCKTEDAVAIKIASGKKAKRSALYWPRMWAHYRAGEAPNGGSDELKEARTRFMAMAGITTGALLKWEKTLSAHPAVLRMVEERKLRPSDVHDIVDHVAWDEQPNAAARVVASRDSAPESSEEAKVKDQDVVPTPTTKKERRQRALGIASNKSRKVTELRGLAAALKRSGKEEFDQVIAALLWAANDKSINNDAALLDVFEEARKNGWGK